MAKKKRFRKAVIGQVPRELLGASSVSTAILLLQIIRVFFPDEAEAIGDRIWEALVNEWLTALQAIIMIWLVWQVYRMWSKLEELSILVRSHQAHFTAIIGGDGAEDG